MAYRRSYTRARSAPRPKSRRYVRRRSRLVRKSRYVRKSRTMMSRRRLLDVTSRKKRDTMIPVTYNSPTGDPTNTVTTGTGVVLQGARVNMLYWCPTARDLSLLNGGAGSVGQTAMRTASNCYMRLLSEKITILTNSPVAWHWRRIVFCAKGPDFHPNVNETAPPASRTPYVETSNGYGRLLQQFDSAGGLGNTQAVILDRLFKGVFTVDWNGVMQAIVDPMRVKLLYDKRVVLRSGNQTGIIKDTKRTHYFNKTLLYDDDESGEVMNTNNYSVENQQGMGDVYVVDFFEANVGSTSSDRLTFVPEATLYWHER